MIGACTKDTDVRIDRNDSGRIHILLSKGKDRTSYDSSVFIDGHIAESVSSDPAVRNRRFVLKFDDLGFQDECIFIESVEAFPEGCCPEA